MPYLTVHMQSIGLTLEEIALIYLALPFTTFLAPPVTGFLVDKFGRYKPVVVISFFLNAAIHHSLMLIPHQETPGITPPGFVMNIPNDSMEVWWSPCPSRNCPEERNLTITLTKCIDYCKLKGRKKSKKRGAFINDKSNGFSLKEYEGFKLENGTRIKRYVSRFCVFSMNFRSIFFLIFCLAHRNAIYLWTLHYLLLNL